MDLSRHTVKAVVNLWALHQVKGRSHDAPGVVGRVVAYQGGGQTTRVQAVDPKTHRILTETGSVYQLGTPILGFAVRHSELLRELGLA